MPSYMQNHDNEARAALLDDAEKGSFEMSSSPSLSPTSSLPPYSEKPRLLSPSPSQQSSSESSGYSRPQQLARSAAPAFKLFCLVLLCFHTSGQTMLMRRSRQPDETYSGRYSAATSIWLGEVLKFVLSCAAAIWDERRKEKRGQVGHGRHHSAWQRVKADVMGGDAWMMAVPAGLYTIQSLLQVFAITMIPSIVYQALSQLKILAAALCSYPLLGRRLAVRQWLMLCVLVLGVVTLNNPERKALVPAGGLTHSIASPFKHTAASHDANGAAVVAVQMAGRAVAASVPVASAQTLGAIAVLLSCFLGSLAGVYMEAKVKKDVVVSLWVRNAQLSIFSLLAASGALVLQAIREGEWAPMREFGGWAWTVVLVRAVGGLIVALVVRYADNILKGFATSFAIVVTLLLRCILYGAVPTTSFFFGITLVMLSSVGYSYFGAKASSAALRR